MPLSDREQQILADIEARLRAEDPRFARAVATETVSTQARRQVKLAVAGFVVGVVLLLGLVFSIWYTVAGLVLMLGSAIYGGTMLKRIGAEEGDDAGGQVRGGLSRYLDDRRGGHDELR